MSTQTAYTFTRDRREKFASIEAFTRMAREFAPSSCETFIPATSSSGILAVAA